MSEPVRESTSRPPGEASAERRRRRAPLRPLRVLFVVPDLAVGGAERHVTTLLPRMNRTRFAPQALCIGDPGALFPDLVAAGVPARALGRAKAQAPLALFQLVAEMRRERPDVVIVRGYSAEGLGRVAAVLARVPCVIVWVHNHGDTAPRGLLRRIADRCLDRITDAYYGVAQAQAAYLTDGLGHPPEKIEIIHNGVDLSGFDPEAEPDWALARQLGVRPGERVVGIVAALRPEKDHALLLRAMRSIVDAEPATRLLVIGDGPERSRLEKLVAELGLTGHVTFTGARHDVAALLALLDVFALSSHSVECFPMALLEAMAAGRPAVCTAVGGVPELVDEGVTGRLVPPYDERALGDAVLGLLRDPATARAFGRAGRRRAEQEFSLERSVEVAQCALERTAGRRPEPLRLTLVLDLAALGGAERVLLDTFHHLDRSVVAPRLICLREAGPLANEFRAAGVPVEVIARRSPMDTRLRRLVRDLRRHRAEVVLVSHHHRAALALGRLAAALSGAASVVAVHDMDLTRVGRRCLPRSAVETLRLSAALLLLTSSQGDYLHREEGVGRFPWRCTREVVIPNGIAVGPQAGADDRRRARAALGLADDDVAVGIVARLSAQKAHEVLLQAIALLAPTHRNLRLVVIGDGPRRAELEGIALDLGISDRTRFMGQRRDVPTLLAGLDVSCLSSTHEGVPLTVIESMAAGLPVVATDCGALRDVVSDGTTGFLVPVRDVAALARRLGELVADGGLRVRLGAAGRVRVEREHRIEATADRLTELLVAVRPDRRRWP